VKEPEVETIVPRALEQHPGHKPRIISDNGPQCIAKDSKQFVPRTGITHVHASRDSKLEAARAKRLNAKSRAAEQALADTVLM
jgi:hypothetical protein